MAASKSNELKIVRLYEAPIQAVWDAWADPAQVAKWWGPRGFTITTHSKDLKPGGHWRYTMHGPDGMDYPNVTHYFEVEKYSKLVYDHGATDDRPALFRVTVLFSESEGKTRLEMTMAFVSAEASEEASKFIKRASGESTWDRLAEYLEQKATGRETFVINRSFAVPISTMFEMWTNPKHFSQWMGPKGSTMEFIRSDIRPGGSTFYVMTSEGGPKLYGRAQYLKVETPTSLVYTQEFVDEHENISRHPFAPTWPEAMLTSVTLSEEGPNQTRVTVCWAPHGATTAEELTTFIQGRGGMTQGWTGSFDKLEAYLN
ncbi:MAG: SRPBCC family protein [Polyangiaceae bacterium]|nr:SRPBCC family protein [Polyangiaceae bacterium]